MKIFIIGSTAYQEKMREWEKDLTLKGHEVRRPRFDDFNMNELNICLGNIEGIKWADEVHVFWDQRSVGTIFDFGATMALNKPIKIIYLNPKTFTNVMLYYEKMKQSEGPHIL